ncbi:MAG TPA: hypothetical protein VGH11_02510, partial [Jatrophihabitans sp.]
MRAAQRHHLRVWLEADLVKRWRAGTVAFDAGLAQLGTLAAIPGVAGIKIADELGYHDGLSSPEAIRSFLTAAAAGLRRVAPGKPLLVDMIVPELGCLPDHIPAIQQAVSCASQAERQYPQLSPTNVSSYLNMHAVSVLDLSTGLLSDATYAGWGTDLDAAQTAAWAKVRQLGWSGMVSLQARKALAHPGPYAQSAAAAAAAVHT